jgi:glutathione S-transferase
LDTWIDRLQTQLKGAVALMELAVSNSAAARNAWLLGAELSQADITTAVAWRFTQHVEKADIPASDFPALFEYSVRAEALPEFKACPLGG